MLWWKTVRKTGHYQEHRLFKRRRAVPQNGTTRPPRHKQWLAGGVFSTNSKTNTILEAAFNTAKGPIGAGLR
jgi:hypothetical protein